MPFIFDKDFTKKMKGLKIYQFIKSHCDVLIILISFVIITGFLARSLIVLTAMPAYKAVLPESPVQNLSSDSPAFDVSLSLFNEKNAWSEFSTNEMQPDDERLRNAPSSLLPFKVMGVLFHRNHDKSLAIIAEGTNQFTVGEGGRLQNSELSVARIFNDRVIIINQGLYEALYLEPDSRR